MSCQQTSDGSTESEGSHTGKHLPVCQEGKRCPFCQHTCMLSQNSSIFPCIELLSQLTWGHLLSDKEGNFQVGGTLPARCHGRALPLLMQANDMWTIPYNTSVHVYVNSFRSPLSCCSLWTTVAPSPPVLAHCSAACVVNIPAATPRTHYS